MIKTKKRDYAIVFAFYLAGAFITAYFLYDIKYLISWKKTILTLFKVVFWPYYWGMQLFNSPEGVIVMSSFLLLAWIVGKIRERF